MSSRDPPETGRSRLREQTAISKLHAQRVLEHAASRLTEVGTRRLRIPKAVVDRWADVPIADTPILATEAQVTDTQRQAAVTLDSIYDCATSLEAIANQGSGRFRYTLLALTHLMTSMSVAPKEQWSQLLEQSQGQGPREGLGMGLGDTGSSGGRSGPAATAVPASSRGEKGTLVEAGAANPSSSPAGLVSSGSFWREQTAGGAASSVPMEPASDACYRDVAAVLLRENVALRQQAADGARALHDLKQAVAG